MLWSNLIRFTIQHFSQSLIHIPYSHVQYASPWSLIIWTYVRNSYQRKSVFLSLILSSVFSLAHTGCSCAVTYVFRITFRRNCCPAFHKPRMNKVDILSDLFLSDWYKDQVVTLCVLANGVSGLYESLTWICSCYQEIIVIWLWLDPFLSLSPSLHQDLTNQSISIDVSKFLV